MPYTDPNTVHNPATAAVAPAAWGDVVRDDLEFLIDPPCCSVSNSAAVTAANLTDTTLNADTEAFDNDAMHSTVTNTSRITTQTPGRYLFTAKLSFAANTGGERRSRFRKNGTTAFPGVALAANNSGSQLSGIGDALTAVMAAGDYMEVQARQGSGGNLDVTLAEFTAIFLTRA